MPLSDLRIHFIFRFLLQVVKKSGTAPRGHGRGWARLRGWGARGDHRRIIEGRLCYLMQLLVRAFFSVICDNLLDYLHKKLKFGPALQTPTHTPNPLHKI